MIVVPDERQLGLFGVSKEEGPRPVVDPEAAKLAAALPPHVKFGSSSWTFPGWKGIVYEGDATLPALSRQGLAAYAKHPLFRAVGIDRSYYGPLTESELSTYAAQLPRGFPTLSKVWDEITTFAFADHPRLGLRAGKRNPRFLDPPLFLEEVLPAYAGAFAPHAGTFLFELARVPGLADAERDGILRSLDRLLDALPLTFTYAFELRTPRLFGPRYLDILRAHRAAHVLNFWTGMPDVGAQLLVPGVLTAPFVVARLTVPPGLRHDDAKTRFEPFDRIVTPQPGLRRDVRDLAVRCGEEGRALTVLVNNKAEGSAPLTVRALAAAVVGDAPPT